MKLPINFLIIILIASCSEKTNSETTEINEFEEYINSLNKIDLPLEYNSNSYFVTLLDNIYDENGFRKFKQIWAELPYGLLFKSDEIVITADLVINDQGNGPYLMTYDKVGNKIDSLNPYNKSGKDMGYEAIEYVTIRPDLSITVIDSTWKSDLNEDRTNIIPNSEKLSVGKLEYYITKKGEIIRK